MHEAARMRVKAHIAAEVPQHLQEVVYKGVQARFPEIQLPPFGRIVTDCYRPPVMRASPPPIPGRKRHHTDGDAARKSRAGPAGACCAR